MLQVETFIPMLLQDVDAMEGARLKRVVLLGDHHQLPPIVQNMALQKFSRLDQSLFARYAEQTGLVDSGSRRQPQATTPTPSPVGECLTCREGPGDLLQPLTSDPPMPQVRAPGRADRAAGQAGPCPALAGLALQLALQGPR